jgi:excisionase family DNA binding protein
LETNQESRPLLRGDIITVGEFADLLELDPSMQRHSSTIYSLLRRGELRAIKVGSDWGFSREAVNRLVRTQIGH